MTLVDCVTDLELNPRKSKSKHSFSWQGAQDPTYRDRINEVVANNFVTDLGLAHAMANLNKIQLVIG